MDPLLNPYRPGAGTRPPVLIGRDKFIDGFGVTLRRATALRPGKSLMVLGLRGVGKTVLLNRFMEIARDEGLNAAYIEAPESGAFRALLVAQLRRILLELDSGPVSRAVRRALSVLKSFSLNLPDGSSISLEAAPLQGQADSGNLASDLTDLLVAVGEAATDRHSGVLVAVDEVQYLGEEELAALITAVHRTAQLDLPVVVAGAGLPQLAGLAGEAKSYAERLFDFPVVGALPDPDARQALAIPAENQGVEIEAGALDIIVDRSGGYPYFLQEWGSHVWNLAPGPDIIMQADAEAAEAMVTAQLDNNFFRVRFDRLTPKEKEYVRAMAQLGPGPHRSGDIASQLGVRVESVAPRRSGLIRKGMIYSPAHGDTAFTVPLFDGFLRRVMPG